MRILLVEDDQQLGQAIKTALKLRGFTVSHVRAGKPALLVVDTNDCDMVILDLGLPDMDGTDVLKNIRQRNPTLPVLILTARSATEDKVAGLDLGADDYLTKPFDMDEMFARLRVIGRRLGTNSTAMITVAGVTMDTASNVVTVDGCPVDFSRRELMVLKALIENAGRILSREQLESKLYEWGEEVQSNAVEVHIHNLRKKLPDKFIHTVRGVGYTVRKS